MAAAFMIQRSQGSVNVLSAGTAPATDINLVVVDAMAEKGIDLRAAGASPKVLEADAVQASDYVITMGCGDECPFFPGVRYLDWVLDDPAGQSLDAVRRIRDDIEARVIAFLDEIGTRS